MQPPPSLEALGDPIYEAFYGLKEQPFAITTDPRFFYLSASHQRAFSELLNGLRRHESILLLTGDTGTGKTTLCRTVLESLGDRTFSALILNPYMSGPEVLRIVLRDFGFVSHEDLRRGALAAADVPQLLDTLEGFLKSLQPLASHAVIVIDEAQSLAAPILDQIRLLTGLEHDRRRLVQVVLCGQPSLLTTIKSESLRALSERITRRVELTPLSPDDVHGYIQHRLGVAGAGDAVRFDEAATQAIAELSRGLPRRINVICDRALQEGRIEGANLISTDLVKRAARALAGVHDPMPVVAAAPVAPPVVVAPPSAAAPLLNAPPIEPRRASAVTALGTPHTGNPTTRSPEPEALVLEPDPFEAVGEARPRQELRELTFGQAPAEEPRPTRTRTIAIAAAAVVALAGAGYAGWAVSVGNVQTVVPPAPRVKVLNTGAPAVAFPVPSVEEINEMLTTPLYFRPNRVAAPTGEPTFAGASVWTGQNP